MFSLARFRTDIGAMLEFVAMTLGILRLAILAIAVSGLLPRRAITPSEH